MKDNATKQQNSELINSDQPEAEKQKSAKQEKDAAQEQSNQKTNEPEPETDEPDENKKPGKPPVGDFANTLISHDYNLADLRQTALRNEIKFEMPSVEQFSKSNPELAEDPETFNNIYKNIENQFRIYKDGKFSQFSTEDV
ncbi:MAG: hypothetical protein ACOCQ4_02030, partial [bacterium]